MDIKDLLEPQAVKALREMNEKMTALSKGITSSPVMEYMRQIEAQKNYFMISLAVFLRHYA